MRTSFCGVTEVSVLASRIRFKCEYQYADGYGNVTPYNKSSDHPLYFAVPLESPKASLVLALAESARHNYVDHPRLKAVSAVCLGGGKGGVGAVGTTPDFYIGCNAHNPDGGFDSDITQVHNTQGIIEVNYDANDLSGESFGCKANDCRIPTAVSVSNGEGQGD